MSATAMSPALENSFIQSLETQLGNHTGSLKSENLAIVSSNPNLDMTAVSRLREAGALVLRTDSESLSKTLEAGPLADSIAWAATEAGVTNLTLIGHSMAAVIPLDNQAGSAGLLQRMQNHNERTGASKLKLKDDTARFVTHPQIKPLLADGTLTVNALFYVQETGVFLKYEFETDDFVLLG
jgi:hypothetical protein